MNNENESSSASSGQFEEDDQRKRREKMNRCGKKNEADRTINRRTMLLDEYIDTVYMLSHALNHQVSALERSLDGGGRQGIVESNLELSSVIARRMLCLIRFRREINDELGELDEMMEQAGLELISKEGRDDDYE